MLEITATALGIFFGVIATAITVRSHFREIRRDYDRRLAEEMARHADARVKEVESLRDFGHLRRNHEQLSACVLELQKEFEEQAKVVIELQVTSRAAFNRIEQIAARMEGGNTLGSR